MSLRLMFFLAAVCACVVWTPAGGDCVLNASPVPWGNDLDILTNAWQVEDGAPRGDDTIATCLNGIDAGTENGSCICTSADGQPSFWGDRCQFLNLSDTSIQITTTVKTVSVKWATSPRLNGTYTFAYRYSTQGPSSNIVSSNSWLAICTEREAVLANLTQNTDYVICVVPYSLQPPLDSVRINTSSADCYDVTTQPRDHQLYITLAIVIGSLMCFALFLLGILRFLVPIVQARKGSKGEGTGKDDDEGFNLNPTVNGISHGLNRM